MNDYNEYKIKNCVYQTEDLKLFKSSVPITLLETDLGFFSTIDNQFIGKAIVGFKDFEGNIWVKHSEIKQHFPNGDSYSWYFDPKRGYWHE